jgi:hypothetical protein
MSQSAIGRSPAHVKSDAMLAKAQSASAERAGAVGTSYAASRRDSNALHCKSAPPRDMWCQPPQGVFQRMPNTSKILIVDDDAELRDALSAQLSLHEEFETVVAENGTKAVETAKAVQIDLVIMDVGLPDIDGREAV